MVKEDLQGRRLIVYG